MDLNQAASELAKSGKAEKLKSLAETEEAKRLAALLDRSSVERAAKSGDAGAMGDILRSVLGTDEGRRLAKKIQDAMK